MGELFKNKYRIESARLKGYDYSSPGFYYVTICTKNREHFFGKIADGQMILNDNGKILNDCWFDLINHYNNLKLDEFVIMPNHFHGIMIIEPPVFIEKSSNAGNKKTHGLFEFVRALKTFSSRKINVLNNMQGRPVWQPRFYDHIVRDEEDLYRIREYIKNNPVKWCEDDYFTG